MNNELTGIRELTFDEIDQVSGGISAAILGIVLGVGFGLVVAGPLGGAAALVTILDVSAGTATAAIAVVGGAAGGAIGAGIDEGVGDRDSSYSENPY